MITKILIIVLVIIIIKSIITEILPITKYFSSKLQNDDSSDNDVIEVDYEEVE